MRKQSKYYRSSLLILPWVLSYILGAAEIHVPMDAATIQAGLDQAATGDTVLVAPGEYVITESLNFNKHHDPNNPESPPIKNITLQSEAGAEQTIIRMSETPNDPEKASVVVFASQESNDSVLLGFTLTGGTGTKRRGRYCLSNSGGGIMCTDKSAPKIIDCRITGNAAFCGGGILCSSRSSPILTNCAITENSGYYGSGIYCGYSTLSLDHCIISHNSSKNEGTIFFESSFSSPDSTITDCTITGNIGTGILCDRYASPALIRCTISENTSLGIRCREDAAPLLSGCTISRNGNSGVYCYKASPEITNCIVWDNVGGSIYRGDETSKPIISFSCIECDTVWPGEGNINKDPLFCGWEQSELFVDDQDDLLYALTGFRLSLSKLSPCIGTGSNGVFMGADADICKTSANPFMTIVLSPGIYHLRGNVLFRNVSVIGSGEGETMIKGNVRGLVTGAILSHLTITGNSGHGISIVDGEAPALVNCTIKDNAGYGIRCLNASPLVTHCTITRNATGGINSRGVGNPTLTDCTISENHGSGLSLQGSPTIINCLIIGNSARNGGGIQCLSPDISNPIIGLPLFINCIITGNAARQCGGGINCNPQTSPIFVNCLITGNSADQIGSGVCSHTISTPAFTNCTLSENNGSGFFLEFHSGYINLHISKLSSCIVWGNASGSIDFSSDDPLPHLKVAFSCLKTPTPWPGAGNINQDPLFRKQGIYDFNRWKTVTIAGEDHTLPDFIVSPGDYRLQENSPCIDAGKYEGARNTDIEGNARPCGDGVDMGAHEAGGCPMAQPRMIRGDVTGDGEVHLDDPIFLAAYLMKRGDTPSCLNAGDANDDGRLNLADVILILNYLFSYTRPPPAAPFPDCGEDPTLDALGCATYPACK